MPTDAAVPISRLAECVLESDADLRQVTERTGLVGPLVGHVGDGEVCVGGGGGGQGCSRVHRAGPHSVNVFPLPPLQLGVRFVFQC